MKASELIEKIHNNEIREGTKIICHKKNKYFDYEFTRYFMGNWFSKVPAEQHTGDDDFDKDMILELCDRSVTYRIVDESKYNSIERLDIEENESISEIISIIDRKGLKELTSALKDLNEILNNQNTNNSSEKSLADIIQEAYKNKEK